MNPIFDFLSKNFNKMPRWVQVITFFVLLVLVIYLYLSPRFITGQVITKTDAGGNVPYRGALLQTVVEGHVLRFKTDEYGYTSIPLVSKFPVPVDIDVFHEDDQSWFPLKISAADTWRGKFQIFKIIINHTPPMIEIDISERDSSETAGTKFWAAVSNRLMATAFADNNDRRRNTPKQLAEQVKTVLPAYVIGRGLIQGAKKAPQQGGVIPPQASPQKIPRSIRISVQKIVAKVLRINPSKVNDRFRFVRKNKLTYVRRIQIIEAIEHKYKFKIPDEHWREFQTVGELVRYVHSRQELERSKPVLRKVINPNDWSSIQYAFPRRAKPVFKK